MNDAPANLTGIPDMPLERVALRLYKTHREMLVRYARRLSRDAAAAEDVVQDAWLLFDRQSDRTAIHEPLGYIRRIIRNLIVARGRRGARETVMPAEEMDDVADCHPSIEADLAARQAMQLVLEAIDAMPARQQAAIRMYHFGGLKLREIAERLDLSVSYVHRLIVDGMKICNERRRSAR